MKAPAVRHRADEGVYYRGLPVHAPPRVHEDAFALVASWVRQGGRVLDLGAGSGAFTRRLADAGMRVEAADSDPAGWRLEVPLRALDLNAADWPLAERFYDGVVAVEVLEHLENPTGVLRRVRRLLAPGGVFVFTTPNVVSVPSRRAMLLRGEMSFFRAGSVFDGGHMTIMPYWLLDDLLVREDAVVLERRFLGDLRPGLRSGRGPLRRPIGALADASVRLAGRNLPREAAYAGSVGYAVRWEA